MIITDIGDDETRIQHILYDEQTNKSLFDLAKGRVVRCHILRLSKNINNDDHLNISDMIIFSFHHIAFDGFSTDIFFDDLEKAYVTDKPLEPLTFDYIDYSIYEKTMNIEEASEFWKKELSSFINTVPQLPYDRYPRDNNIRTGRGLTVSFDLSQNVVNHMKQCLVDHDTTIFQVGLSAFSAFLFKLTQETDLCILTMSANRSSVELKECVGYFANTIPQRLTVDPTGDFSKLLKYVKELNSVLIRYANFPFQEMNILPSIRPVFLCDPFIEPINMSDSTLVPAFNFNQQCVALFDLTCSFHYNLQANDVTVVFNASHDLFDKNTVQLLAHRFQYFIEQLFYSTSLSSVPLCQLSLLLSHEINFLPSLYTNQTSQQTNLLPIHLEFGQKAIDHPQKLALILDDQCLSYAEVLSFSQQIAQHLIIKQKVQSNDIVIQCVERSIEMPLGILGILMCGAIYCPIASSIPSQRLENLLLQTQTTCILTHNLTVNKFPSTTTNLSSFDFNRNIDTKENVVDVPPVDVDYVAYIIFTSGSTGQPKGVQLTHRNFLLTVASYSHNGSILGTDTALQITPCSFDAHVPELLGCLILGGTSILLHPDGNMQLSYIIRTIQCQQASYMHSIPSHLRLICDYLDSEHAFDYLQTLRSLCSSGEPMDTHSLKTFRQNTKATIYNLYGPAECTDVSIYKIDSRSETPIEPSCIGNLSRNLRCRVLDTYMQPILPDKNQTGELYVAGESVFPGYLRREDLTRNCLIQDLCSDGLLYYKTGDLVKIDSQCRLHFVGRKDFQVKLRGQRVELAEIEQTINEASADVTKCVVMKKENETTGYEYLIAYIQSKDSNIEPILQKACEDRLPSYMIPSAFVILPKLPLSVNGKIDRSRLPSLDSISSSSMISRESQPKTELEKCLSSIWCDILKMKTIPSTNVSFFKIGGNSLLLMQLHHIYQKQFARSLNIIDLLRRSTIVDHIGLLGNDLIYV